MRPPRFRLRTLLIAVAVVSVALGGELMRRRRISHREQAASHSDAEELSRAYADDARGQPGPIAPQRVAWGEVLAAYHAAMSRKYERAARYPWLPVAPDPPPP
jgi:hypothetical protein